MSVTKIHLEYAEFDAIERYAKKLGVTPEDIAYAGLNQLMLKGETPELNKEILETREWRKNTLPMWSDSAGSVHIYEGQPDCEPSRSKLH